MKEKIVKLSSIIIWILFIMASIWIAYYLRIIHEEKLRWIWNIAYCDAWFWSPHRWIVKDVEWKYLLLDPAESKCYYYCRCDWWENFSWLWCYDDAEYNLFEWMPMDDDLSKVWMKTDCYMTWDIKSILDYRDRNI
jgi:hypothetical protein